MAQFRSAVAAQAEVGTTARLAAIVHRKPGRSYEAFQVKGISGARGFHDTPRYALTDDHIPLLDAGIPAVDVIDFDYPAWHTHLDLPDRVSAASLAEVSRVAGWIVYRSALARP